MSSTRLARHLFNLLVVEHALVVLLRNHLFAVSRRPIPSHFCHSLTAGLVAAAVPCCSTCIVGLFLLTAILPLLSLSLLLIVRVVFNGVFLLLPASAPGRLWVFCIAEPASLGGRHEGSKGHENDTSQLLLH